MFRELVAVCLLAVAVFAAPIDNFDDIPEEYKSLIPTEVAEHLKSITPEEKVVLKELAKQHTDFKNEDEFLAALKEKSPTLHEKAVKLHNFLKEKVDALGDEAKNFVKTVIADGRKLHTQYLSGTKPSLAELKAIVKGHLDGYTALSADAKADFEKNFPILTKTFNDPKVKALVEKYVN